MANTLPGRIARAMKACMGASSSGYLADIPAEFEKYPPVEGLPSATFGLCSGAARPGNHQRVTIVCL